MSYWTNPPNPYTADWQCAPVPGWGANCDVIGNPLVAVGQVYDIAKIGEKLAPTKMVAVKKPSVVKVTTPKLATEEPVLLTIVEEEETGVPWWYFAAGAAVLAAGIALAINMEWF